MTGRGGWDYIIIDSIICKIHYRPVGMPLGCFAASVRPWNPGANGAPVIHLYSVTHSMITILVIYWAPSGRCYGWGNGSVPPDGQDCSHYVAPLFKRCWMTSILVESFESTLYMKWAWKSSCVWSQSCPVRRTCQVNMIHIILTAVLLTSTKGISVVFAKDLSYLFTLHIQLSLILAIPK